MKFEQEFFFDMTTYNAQVRAEMIGFISLSLAIISFSEKFKHKTFMVLAGLATLLITIINTILLISHYWNFLMDAPDSAIPPYMSRTSLIISQAMRFVYVLIIIIIAFEISTSQLWPF